MMHRTLLPTLIPLSLMTTACGVSTSDLRASFVMSVQEGELYVAAVFDSADGESPSDLDDGDRVVVTFRGTQTELAHKGRVYAALIDVASLPVADEQITIAVDRDGETSATETLAVPPEPVLDPIPAFVSRAKDFTLSWSTPSEDAMGWSIGATCLESASGAIEANATSVTIAASTLKAIDATTCTADLKVRRIRHHAVESPFAGGVIQFTWESATQFASYP